uniref:Glyco_hydro_38C domain-containing protein n=1 Tax=Rhabditophanes sp. KR3021 TaxID=114890 RepID=A0AC35TTC7_9BILA
MPFSQHFSYYPGNGKEAFQQDGAYIFAPSTNSSISFNDTIKSTQYFGDITNQTQQIINPWISQTISLSKSQEYIDFTFTIGPIPKEKIDPIAKDIVTTYITNIHSQNKFTTDCNGRQTMVRTLNSAPDYIYLNEEPVAGNYYPITTSISLEDGVNSMACLVDRAEGGSSLKEGALELMVHRRAFADDHLGVEEPLDEEDTQGNGLIMKGTHRIYIGQKDNIAAITKRHQIELFNEPILTYAPWANKSMADYKKSYKSSYEGLANDLPDGVNLLTLETISTSPLIWFMRVERYIEGGHVKIGEEPMTVNVASIFPNFSVKKMVEVNLQGTTFLTDKKKLLKENKISKYSKNVDPSLVYLYPMQIRSFYIYL